MSNEKSIIWKIKPVIWAIASGVIVTFFFGTNFISDTTGFNPGGSILFMSPLVCGFILGILTWEYDIYHTVMASILLTIVAVGGIIIMLISPSLANVMEFHEENYFPVIRNVMVSVVLIFPMSLLGSMSGKFLTGSAILSPEYKVERAHLRAETDEWYRMLEEYLAKKEDAPRTLDQEKIKKLIEEKITKEGNVLNDEESPE
jgi:hypothetical protein